MMMHPTMFHAFAGDNNWAEFYTTASTPNPVVITTEMPVGEIINFNFGDGALVEVVGTASKISTSHIYTVPAEGTKISLRSRNIKNLIYFSIDGERLSGLCPDFSGMAALERIWLRNNFIGGRLRILGCVSLQELWSLGNPLEYEPPPLTGLISLEEIWLNGGGELIGDIPSLSGLSNLNIARFDDNKITGFAGGMVNGIEFDASDNQIVQAKIDLILADSRIANVGAGDSILLDGGTNSTPGAQGLLDIDWLRTNGATVTHN